MKAAKVFPEPVWAATSTFRLALIAGQACVWAAVGARKVRSSQAATAGWNNPEDAVINSDAQTQHNSALRNAAMTSFRFAVVHEDAGILPRHDRRQRGQKRAADHQSD
jgi:hypothetical protein